MDEDNMDIEAEAWRRDRLGDEPIYCAAPPPSDPDDIICYGSDEELDDEAKIAKRLRYETQGLRFLQGKPPRIFSASLHGPFEKASGWNNPWLPKQPVMKDTIPTSQPTPKPLPAVKKRLRRHLERNNIIPSTSNSMRCHLPSPESNRELPLAGSPPETDKRSRIQAWAKDVSRGTVLEKDAFWAPNQAYTEESDGSNKKRPAGKDWLKKQSKRKRLGTPQGTITTSTPTPLLAAQAQTRRSSVPTNTGQTLKPTIPGTMASQSFELATPSSTANQSVSEAPKGGQYKDSIRHETMSPQAIPSEIYDAAIQKSNIRSISITVDGINHQPSPTSDQTPKWVPNAETQDYAKQACEYLRNGQFRQSQEADDIGSESYIDESFHYRTRPAKQTLDVEDTITDSCPKPTQTRTPSPPVHEDAVNIAVHETKKPHQLPQSSPMLRQQVSREREARSQRARSLPDPMYCQEEGSVSEGSKEYFSIPSRSKIRASKDQQAPVENSNSTDNGSNNVLIPPESAITLHIKSEVIRNDEQNPTHDDLRTSQALHEEKVATLSRILDEVKRYPTENQPVVNGGSAGDPMGIDGSTLYDANQLSTSHHVFKRPIPDVIATIEPNEPPEITMKQATQGDESDTESTLVVVPQSRLEWGVAEIPDKSAVESNVVGESKASTIEIKTKEVFDRNNPTETSQLEHSETSPPRSPWVTELAPGADLTIEHIKSEPVDDIPSPSPCPSHFTLFSSQPSGHGTPVIRPSQQSPWGGKLLEPLNIEQHGHHLTDVEAISTRTHPIATTSQVHQSPWAESSTGLKPYPKYSPLSPAPAISNEKPLQPHSQLSMATVDPDNQCLEPLKENPITPPRMPVSHIRTPDLERSIKSFAMFNSPSPKRQGQQSIMRSSSTGHPQGTFPVASDSERSTRRVTFALFSDDGDDTETRRPLKVGKAASPPPKAIVNTGDEDMGELFHNHFDIMKRRASGEKVRRRSRPLLPSSSQQMSVSPSVGAMAEAFQAADAYIPRARGSPIEEIKKNPNQEIPSGKQSPWRKESQGVDDVADVMNNLDDFLNAWDVETELEKSKQEPSRGVQNWEMDL
ncbi:uncharacterized protein F4807DRAFT_408448 [Annulohypoxylon truncatum]|uniref:uncharacterized protein n=1 Tax=Annulohypoxylon truncatum TaxID=327061 RepID=UPI00200796E9|nr:uncharacterized protein F4807DRAFT_408448 [Annulohypoxylon truncatum]KAI1213613.1 hypothetical protein F4807DRAFT_408448 [Annulohypoxylon truncatum]